MRIQFNKPLRGQINLFTERLKKLFSINVEKMLIKIIVLAVTERDATQNQKLNSNECIFMQDIQYLQTY